VIACTVITLAKMDSFHRTERELRVRWLHSYAARSLRRALTRRPVRNPFEEGIATTDYIRRVPLQWAEKRRRTMPWPNKTTAMNQSARVRSILTALLTSIATTVSAADKQEFTVATSIYPGWMDNWLMEMPLEKGKPTFLERRTREAGVTVAIKKFKEYVPSIEAMVAGKVDACTMTLGEALSFPEDSGVDAVIFLVHDYSNGNDGVLVPKGWKLEAMKGKTIIAEEFSVSQFLVYRWLQKAGNPRDYLVFKNTPGDDVSKGFPRHRRKAWAVAGATWNPHVLRIMQSGKADLAFSSREIPGEIVDSLVVRKDRIAGREKAIEAYVKAHYDVMDYFTAGPTRDRAIKAMTVAAEFTGDDAPLYSRMLDSTRFYTTREETAKFMESAEIRETEKKLRGFLKEFGAFKSPDPEKLAVEFDTRFLK
jgi:NitT/TauT family transport system substrate-binding protein